MISLLIALAGCFLLAFIVFGGGQIFIPFFKILLIDMMQVDVDLWESALTLSNATPGIFSLKLAFVTGYLAAYGEWWGYLAMFLTYTVFIIIPIFIMIFSMRIFKNLKDNKYMMVINRLMKPIITGILVSLCIQLLMSAMFPIINFNQLNDYASIKTHPFFKDWRLWTLYIFMPIDLILLGFIMWKYKPNVVWVILGNILLALVVFQPWLT